MFDLNTPGSSQGCEDAGDVEAVGNDEVKEEDSFDEGKMTRLTVLPGEAFTG